MKPTKARDDGTGTAAHHATVARALAIAVAVALLLSSVVAGVGAAATDADRAADSTTDSESALVVDLETDGDATVTVVLTFDLEDDADRAAFEELRTNDTRRERLETRTATRLENVAEGASEETGREMAIDGTAVSFETDDDADRGIVAIAATWHNLAAVEDGNLRLDEPFASGFAPDRPFVLHPPDGYDLERSTHEPTSVEDGRLVWSAGTDLDGYEVLVSSAEDGSSATGSDAEGDGADDAGADGQPGFGVAIGLLSLLGGGWLYRSRSAAR